MFCLYHLPFCVPIVDLHTVIYYLYLVAFTFYLPLY